MPTMTIDHMNLRTSTVIRASEFRIPWSIGLKINRYVKSVAANEILLIMLSDNCKSIHSCCRNRFPS